MKRIIILLGLLFGSIFAPIFANYQLDKKLDYIFDNKIDKKIESKYQDKQKICQIKKLVYKKIEDKLKNIKKEKYQKLIKYIINYLNNRTKTIKECQITIKNNIEKTNNINNPNPILHFQIDTKLLYDSIKNIKNIFVNRYNNKEINLNIVEKASNKYRNNFFKIKNTWYMFTQASYLTTDNITDRLINQLKQEHPGKYIIIYKNYVYIIAKDKILSLKNIDPTKSLSNNKNVLAKQGIYFLDKFYWTKKNKEGIIIAAISEVNGHLVYFILGKKTRYYAFDNNMPINLIVKDKNIKLIIKDNNRYYSFLNNAKIYNLGNISLYKNIDKKLLGKILYSSFHKIINGNLPYSVKKMYTLMLFSKRYNNKQLKDLYKYIVTNIKYSQEISNLLKKNITQQELDNTISSDKNLYKIWNMFDILQTKVAICQSLSELLSITALFNGQKGDIATGWIGYAHQISKINNFYYDPTNDLGKNSNFKYFGMTKKEVEKYFTFTNNFFGN